jgi:nitroreductase
MQAQECIKTRRSCRKFLAEEVPREIIEESIKDAQRAPSYKNSQPWEVIAVRGEKLKKLKAMLIDLLNRDEAICPDIPEPKNWPEEIDKRIKETAILRTNAFGINPGPDSMKKSREGNFSFYNAPAGLFFYQDGSLGEWSLLDMGMFIENVILGLHSRGIASVPQAFLVDYSKQVKSFLGISGDKKLILGMSTGYPDTSDIKYKFTSPREFTGNVLKWQE